MAHLGRSSRVIVLGAILASLVPAGQAAAEVGFTEFPVSAQYGPGPMATGSDGNVWFAESNDDVIGRITPGGAITQFPLPATSHEPRGIALGPDGAIWFSETGSGAIGRIAASGTITEFPVPGRTGPYGLAAGPDGNIWFTNVETESIAAMTPAGAIDGFSAALHATPLNIIAGPDGALWFTEGGLVTGGSGAIGRITTSGSVSEYVLPTPAGHDSEAWELVVGPDGNLWFSWITLDPSLPASTATGSIGRITPSGTITEFPLPAGHRATGITRGPDGNLWFADDQGNTIGQMTTSGAVTMYPVPTPNSSPSDITTGSDGNLWFSEFNFASSKIGRLSLTGATPPPVVPVVTPSISSFSPASGSPGTAVAVAGSNLLGTTSVRFGVTLQPTYSIDPTGTLITTTVPAGATTGPITIVTPWGTAVSAMSFGVTAGPSSHVRNVTLRLRQHLRAEGRIVVEDGFVACAQHRRVRVQRRDGNGWRTVAAGGTDVDGRYSVTVTDRTAWYRATIAEITLPSGDVCDAAISGTRHHAA